MLSDGAAMPDESVDFCILLYIMKICCNCKIEKPETEFNKRSRSKDGLEFRCKECSRKSQRERARKRKKSKEYIEKRREKDRDFFNHRKEIVNNLKTPCAKCGDKRIYLIDFHHVDPKEKSFDISKSTYSMDNIRKEIEKCVCLCRNCHAEFHYTYGKNPENPIEAIREYLSCSTTTGYTGFVIQERKRNE